MDEEEPITSLLKKPQASSEVVTGRIFVGFKPTYKPFDSNASHILHH